MTRIALCQIDTRVGDLRGNAARILGAVDVAKDLGAEVAVLPELALTGYPPRDLLLEEGFAGAAADAARALAAFVRGIEVVLGTALPSARRLDGRRLARNVALVLKDGRIVAARPKTLLPNYDVFDEPRVFVPGRRRAPVDLAGTTAGLLICEDLWDEGYPVHPPGELLSAGARLLISLNASPYRRGVLDRRLALARRLGAPLVYVNAVGAEDELIFDGRSFAVDARGHRIAQLPAFDEAVEVVDLDVPDPRAMAPLPGPDEETFRALALGVRDFVRKNGLGRAWVALSGGIDSAIVACIAKEALGADRVEGLAMPSRYSDPRSLADARALARSLGIGFRSVAIDGVHRAAEDALAAVLARPEAATAAENVQARLRAMLLFAHVNAEGGIVLNTSNKTELALGYGTLYGDLAGGISVIGDLMKTEVYALARWYDRAHPGVIPPFTLTRPPSAELRPGQVDPFDYARIDPIVAGLIDGRAPEALAAAGHDPAEVSRLDRLHRGSEHKRRQSPIVLKVSGRAFGAGRRIPVTRVRPAWIGTGERADPRNEGGHEDRRHSASSSPIWRPPSSLPTFLPS